MGQTSSYGVRESLRAVIAECAHKCRCVLLWLARVVWLSIAALCVCSCPTAVRLFNAEAMVGDLYGSYNESSDEIEPLKVRLCV